MLKRIRGITLRRKRHGSGCFSGWTPSSTSWDSDSMIGLGLLLSPFLLLGAIGFGLWWGSIFVWKKVLKQCRHEEYAVNVPEHNHRYCNGDIGVGEAVIKCGAWQTLDMSQRGFIDGQWQGSEKMKWQPHKTSPWLCRHRSERDIMVETEDNTIWICPRCGCWRDSENGPWERAYTCPVNGRRYGGGEEPPVAVLRTDEVSS